MVALALLKPTSTAAMNMITTTGIVPTVTVSQLHVERPTAGSVNVCKDSLDLGGTVQWHYGAGLESGLWAPSSGQRGVSMLKDHKDLIDEVVEDVMDGVKADADLLLESMADDIYDLVEASVWTAVERTVLGMKEIDDDDDGD